MSNENNNVVNNAINNANKRPDDISTFFDESANSGFKFKDVVFLVLRNLHWFLLCALVGGLIAYYKVRKEDRIYSSYASLLIKTSMSSGSESMRGSAALNALSSGPIISTVNNEIMILKSQSNMESMVRLLNLNVAYSYSTKVSKRNKDLYKESPVEVDFLGLDDEVKASFSVKPVDQNHVILDDFGGSIPAMKVRLNDTVISPIGKFVVKPTWRYNDFHNISITVKRRPVSMVASFYRRRVSVIRDNEKNAIYRNNLVYQDGEFFTAVQYNNPSMLSNNYVKASTHFAADDPYGNMTLATAGEPKFTDAASGNFSLKSGSPLEGKGVVCDWMQGGATLDAGSGTYTIDTIGEYGVCYNPGKAIRRIPDGASAPSIGAFECQSGSGLLIFVR